MSKSKSHGAGMTAGDHFPDASPEAQTRDRPRVAEVPRPRQGSKQALVVDLLSRSEGVSLTDLVAATGWLPHTARAALTGLRKRGFAIDRGTGHEGVSVYRIATPEPEGKPKRRTARRRSAAAVAAPSGA